MLDQLVIESDEEPRLVAVVDVGGDTVEAAIQKAEEIITGLNDGRLDHRELAKSVEDRI